MKREEIRHKAGSIVDGMASNNVPSEICDSYYQGFIEGAKWADKTMMERVCNWLKQSEDDYYKYNAWKGYYVDFDELIEDLKKAMELCI